MNRAKTMGFLMVQAVLVCFPVIADEPEKIIEKIQSFDVKPSPLTAITGCEHSATCLLGYYDRASSGWTWKPERGQKSAEALHRSGTSPCQTMSSSGVRL